MEDISHGHGVHIYGDGARWSMSHGQVGIYIYGLRRGAFFVGKGLCVTRCLSFKKCIAALRWRLQCFFVVSARVSIRRDVDTEMCGIIFQYRGADSAPPVLPPWMARRGPSCSGVRVVKRDTATGRQASTLAKNEMVFMASILHLRGEDYNDGENMKSNDVPLSEKCYDHDTGVCDNYILLFNGEIYDGLQIKDNENDGRILLCELIRACQADTVPELIEGLRGPWTFVFYDPKADRLWYGRDAIGRRSLLVNYDFSSQSDESFTLASVALQREYLLDTSPSCIQEKAGKEIPNPSWAEVPPGLYFFDFCSAEHKHLPFKSEALNIIRYQKRDGNKSALSQDMEVKDANNCQSLHYNLLTDNLSLNSSMDDHVSAILRLLDESISKRVHALKGCLKAKTNVAAPFAVGFSGGVDSTIIAALLDRHLPIHCPIDLPNVSFDGAVAPDRVNAISALQELQRLSPQRVWRLIEIDVSPEEVDAVRDHVLQLLTPSNTYMDLNIGTALWYTAKAAGRIQITKRQQTTTESFTSEAPVLLLGTGIDEQCAGYSRHFSRFRDFGWEGLQNELSMDVERLWCRNLGRDDRLVSDHGREARHPFLDENLMESLLKLPLQSVADLHKPKGVGDKWIIRQIAFKIGLREASCRVKRAIQFGSRISKLSNRREFGSNRKANNAKAGSCKVPRDESR